MSKKGHGEHIYQQYLKVRFPVGNINKEMEHEARQAFFTGVWATLGLIRKCPKSVLASMLNDLADEAHAQVKATTTDKLVSGILKVGDTPPLSSN